MSKSWNKKELTTRVDQRVLGWLGHVGRIEYCRTSGSKWNAGTRKTDVRGWMDGLKAALGSRRLTMEEAARQCEKDRKE